jgi:acyl-[acyl-carrier-protein]-phospholipid O-acyltransferase/long-chain-fatty-acid--[acyl-carrier-protein] ligase
MYLVPLDSFIQVASPKTHRGQIVATVNLLSFFFVLLSALSLYVIGDVLHLPPDVGFSIIGVCALLNALMLTISMYGYLIRFISFLMSTILFPEYLRGREKVPLDQPSLFLVPQSMWPWVIVLLASQRKRMRIFTIFDHTATPFPTILRRFVYISDAESLAQLSPDGQCADMIRHSFERGTSIAIFCSKKTVSEQGKEFCQKWATAMKPQELSFFYVAVPEEGQKTSKEALCAHIESMSI